MILCLQAANGPISMQHSVSRFDKIKSRLYMIMSGPDEWLPLGVHCDGVSEFFFSACLQTTGIWLVAWFMFLSAVHVSVMTESSMSFSFFSSLAVNTFMDSLTKPRNNQWKQLPFQCSRCLSLWLLSVHYYSMSSDSLFCIYLCTYQFLCAVVNRWQFVSKYSGGEDG